MLCSFIKDICSNRTDTPSKLQRAFDHANHGQQRPTTGKLIEILRAVIEGFGDIYLIIDAVDECPKFDGGRAKFLHMLQEILSWRAEQPHIFVTSRLEIDIVDSFEQYPRSNGNFRIVEAQGPQCEYDIQRYLEQRLQTYAFSRWSWKLKEEVKTKLASRAKGM
jgi:ankyrin repeat domain-containing protein 50